MHVLDCCYSMCEAWGRICFVRETGEGDFLRRLTARGRTRTQTLACLSFILMVILVLSALIVVWWSWRCLSAGVEVSFYAVEYEHAFVVDFIFSLFVSFIAIVGVCLSAVIYAVSYGGARGV